MINRSEFYYNDDLRFLLYCWWYTLQQRLITLLPYVKMHCYSWHRSICIPSTWKWEGGDILGQFAEVFGSVVWILRTEEIPMVNRAGLFLHFFSGFSKFNFPHFFSQFFIHSFSYQFKAKKKFGNTKCFISLISDQMGSIVIYF